MPSLNFKPRFARAVAEGSKPHTIRAWRKHSFRVGDDLAFFSGMRTKKWRRLRPNARCTAAVAIVLDVVARTVISGGKQLAASEIKKIAHKDGFRNVDEFWNFFFETHGHVLRGQLIHWQQ